MFSCYLRFEIRLFTLLPTSFHFPTHFHLFKFLLFNKIFCVKGSARFLWTEINFFHDGDPYHNIETSSLICSTNQWTAFYMMGTSVMKELIQNSNPAIQTCSKSSIWQFWRIRRIVTVVEFVLNTNVHWRATILLKTNWQVSLEEAVYAGSRAAHLGSSQTSVVELFCENSWRQKAAKYFCEKSPIKDVWHGPN